MGGPTSRRDLAVGLVLGAAFIVSVVGDFWFETQWTNPRWYLFELCVWGPALALTVAILPAHRTEPPPGEGATSTRPARRP